MPIFSSRPWHLTLLRCAGLAVGVRDELGHDEQADAARAGRRALDPGQDQVDDVLGQVVLAARDPDSSRR